MRRNVPPEIRIHLIAKCDELRDACVANKYAAFRLSKSTYLSICRNFIEIRNSIRCDVRCWMNFPRTTDFSNSIENMYYFHFFCPFVRLLPSDKIQDSLLRLEICLDQTWDALNTGYWKNVPITYRYSYTICSAFKVSSSLTCDSFKATIPAPCFYLFYIYFINSRSVSFWN